MAPALIGCELLVDGVGGIIVEVERYEQDDPASHSFRGPSRRNATMFGPPGRLYVYLVYGIHWCANLVADEEGRGAAILLRAIEPRRGVAAMRARRGRDGERQLCSGPGKLAQALAIDGADDGASVVNGERFQLHRPDGPVGAIARGSRVGISRAVAQPWRYALQGSPFVSRPAVERAAA